MEKKKQEIILGILFLIILIFVAVNSEIYSARIDITENKIFTLSDVSKNVHREISEQMYITYYLTDGLRNTNPDLYPIIEDILKQFEAASHGKIKLSVVDPERDDKLNEVQAYEIMPFKGGVQGGSPGKESITFRAFSGIVIQYLDKTPKVLPFVQATDTLEFDLLVNIRSLVREKSKRVGFLIDKDDFDKIKFGQVAIMLKQSLDMTEVIAGQDIPDDIETIFIVGGSNLDKFELYPVDQFIMRGGKVLFATDAIVVNTQYGVAFPVKDAPIFGMLKNYGVTIEPELIMEHNDLAHTPNRFPTSYNYFFPTFAPFASRENPITTRFGGVSFFWASPLSLAPPAGVKGEILINTSPYAVRVKDEFPLNPEEVAMMYNYYGSQAASAPLVAALSGNFPSYFKDQEIPKKEGAARDWNKTESLSAATNIIVAGDADFLSPSFLDYYNVSFLINCIQWLSNDTDLLAVRTRVQRDTSLGKIQEPEKRATLSIFAIIFNMVGIPLAVILFGVIKFLIRRSRKYSTK